MTKLHRKSISVHRKDAENDAHGKKGKCTERDTFQQRASVSLKKKDGQTRIKEGSEKSIVNQ